jgi:hypothetical protein
MVWTSLFGIITLVLLARALGFARAPTLADADAARRLAVDAISGFRPAPGVADTALAADRRAALVAGSDGRVVLVRPHGDRWVVRVVNGAAASVDAGRLRLATAEWLFAPVDLDLGPAAASWARRL